MDQDKGRYMILYLRWMGMAKLLREIFSFVGPGAMSIREFVTVEAFFLR